MNINLWVSKLNLDTTEESLRSLFADIGEITAISMPTNSGTGQNKGYAFVTMKNESDNLNAISMLDGYELDERRIRVAKNDGSHDSPFGKR